MWNNPNSLSYFGVYMSYTPRVHFIVSLMTVGVAAGLSHITTASAGKGQFVFFLQFNL